MNRRQILVSAGAAALASGLPGPKQVLQPSKNYIEFFKLGEGGERTFLRRIYMPSSYDPILHREWAQSCLAHQDWDVAESHVAIKLEKPISFISLGFEL
jgi:hypothetical protein